MWTLNYTLVYDGNGADAGSMTSVNVANLQAGSQRLVASNYSRAGYGFAGWSLDSNAGSKLLSGQSVTVYGPNETITINNAFFANADPVTSEIKLYAVWLSEDSTYTMQTFGTTECSALGVGDLLALKDTRDNNTYAVAKLNDGHCWMVENLRLIPSAVTFDSSNTNNPETNFITAASGSASSNTMCNADNAGCVDTVRFNSNNINRNNTESYNSNTLDKSWYGYGVMYNWYTASAGRGNFTMSSGSVTGDICPAGWRLPTGGASSDFTELNRLVNNNATNTVAGLAKFPNNFIRSGDFN